MTVATVRIDNYRNLCGLEFTFNNELNFIIGENDLGKSNFIDLLDVIFSFTRFSAADFFDINRRIKIELSLAISHAEQKIFNVTSDFITMVATQKTPDSNIIYHNAQNGFEIFPEQIRCVNFFRYDSIKPLDLNFTKFSNLPKIIDYYTNEYGPLNDLETSKKILIMIELLIIEQIFNLSETRMQNINNARKKTKSGFPIIFAFDELEMHLHPYMQRSLVIHLSKIIANDNELFFSILKNECGIESFFGQLFIVTHSPNILLNDYKQFIRFYKQGNSVGAVCGERLNVKNDKHLLKNFIYFKEAFFSKFVIVVEGDTEFAVLPEFAENILNGQSFDSYGVSVIKADGKTSVKLVMNILQAFKINNVGMVDRDDDTDSTIKARLKSPPYLYTTTYRDFEEELIETISFKNYFMLDKFLFSDDYQKSTSFSRLITDPALWKKKVDKYNLQLPYPYKKGHSVEFSNYINNKKIMKLFYLLELSRKKGISFWHEVGFEINKRFIPKICKTIIYDATNV